MQFTTDDGRVEITLSLDTEPDVVDLTQDGLGDKCLDIAVDEMQRCHRAAQSADGDSWAPNRPATIRAKGHDRVGIRSGSMLDPSNVAGGPRDIQARSASYRFPSADSGKVTAFHNGNDVMPPRPLVGWTDGAKSQVQALIADAVQRADVGGELRPDEPAQQPRARETPTAPKAAATKRRDPIEEPMNPVTMAQPSEWFTGQPKGWT